MILIIAFLLHLTKAYIEIFHNYVNMSEGEKECQQIAKQELKVVYVDRPQCSEIEEEIELSL